MVKKTGVKKLAKAPSKPTAATPKQTLQKKKLSGYEKVIVRDDVWRNQEMRKQTIAMKQAQQQLHEQQLHRKWFFMMIVLAGIMLVIGLITGFFVGATMKRKPEYHPKKTMSIFQQCVANLRIKSTSIIPSNDSLIADECFVEQLPQQDGLQLCNSSFCGFMEWWLHVEGENDSIVSFYYAGDHARSWFDQDFRLAAGTDCGPGGSICEPNTGVCTASQKSSSLLNNSSYPSSFYSSNDSISFGRWIETCDNTRIQCSRFVNTKIGNEANNTNDDLLFNASKSEVAFQQLAQLTDCNESRVIDHCNKSTGVVSAALGVQFLRCDTNTIEGRRSVCGTGIPLKIYVCQPLCKSVANSTVINNHITNLCDQQIDGAPQLLVDGCVVRCKKSNKLIAMPDGVECGTPRKRWYCLMGKCYESVLASNCSDN